MTNRAIDMTISGSENDSCRSIGPIRPFRPVPVSIRKKPYWLSNSGACHESWECTGGILMVLPGSHCTRIDLELWRCAFFLLLHSL
jgi:hypothetical protein